MFDLDRENRLTRNGVVERLHDRFRTKGHIRRAFNLHQAPAISLAEDVNNRAAGDRVTVENSVQYVRGETIRQILHTCPVTDPDKRIVGHGVVDARRRQQRCQPAMAVAVELESERVPGRYAQIDQPQLGVDEIKVEVQTLACRRAQVGLPGALVVPRLIRRTGFPDRNIMHQSGMIATSLDDRRDGILLANMCPAMCSIFAPADSASFSAFARSRSRKGSAKRG